MAEGEGRATALHCEWLGRIGYREALALQYRLVEERRAGRIGDRLLLLEHPDVITVGRRGSSDDIIAHEAELRREQIEVHRITRGGEVTYHGPGQLVGYLIFSLRSHIKRIAALMHGIEGTLGAFLQREYGITTQGDQRHPGVWVGERKIAAVGVSVQHGITLHGFALNIATDLERFSYIVACGIRELAHTSLLQERPSLPREEVALARIAERLTPYFAHMHREFFAGV